LLEASKVEQGAYYCVIVTCNKGRIALRVDRGSSWFAPVLLRLLRDCAKERKCITVVKPGLLQLQLGMWPRLTHSGVAMPATIARGSVNVTDPSPSQPCNLLVARKASRRIDRLYSHVGSVIAGLEIIDTLSDQDYLTDVSWGRYGDGREASAKGEESTS
jgi:hypothetical protein